MTLPEWLAARLRDENPDGVTRAARLGSCPRCRGPVLRGLDDDRCAIPVEVTLIELDHFGEYLALARGLRTFYLAKRQGSSGNPRWEVDPRYLCHIRAEHRRYPVVPEHRCDVWLPHWPDGLLNRWKPPTDYDGPPPF